MGQGEIKYRDRLAESWIALSIVIFSTFAERNKNDNDTQDIELATDRKAIF